jgi:MFS family permease
VIYIKKGGKNPILVSPIPKSTEHSDGNMTESERSSSQVSSLRGLLVSQFCGAFNDNAWKLIVAFLAIKQVATELGSSGPAFETASQTQTTIAFAIFTLPLMLISLVAGVFSDRFSKRSVIIAMKGVEVGLMGLGTLALFLNPAGGWLPLEWELKVRYLAPPNMESFLKSFPTNASPLGMAPWSFGPLPPSFWEPLPAVPCFTWQSPPPG